VLVRVHAAGVLLVEWQMRQGFFKNVFPVTFPYIPGSAFAGVVEIGPSVTTFKTRFCCPSSCQSTDLISAAMEVLVACSPGSYGLVKEDAWRVRAVAKPVLLTSIGKVIVCYIFVVINHSYS
jgi:hypothetical protein